MGVSVEETVEEIDREEDVNKIELQWWRVNFVSPLCRYPFREGIMIEIGTNLKNFLGLVVFFIVLVFLIRELL